MFTNITFNNKIKITIIVFFVFLIICYKVAIKKTLQEYQNYKEDVNSSSILSIPDQSANLLKLKAEKIEKIEKLYTIDTSIMDRKFLAVLDNYCYDYTVILKEYKPLGVVNKAEKIWTRSVTIEGDFLSILKLLYAFEQKDKQVRIASIEYKSYIDNTEKKTKLICTFYVQNLISSYNG